jgi:glyoxylase-like metal-dependent hydrolase (beta-lactamase superfamily II)
MEWTWRLLRNGTFWLDAGSMFGIIPRVVWSRWLTPDDRNRMPLQQNSLLLESGGKLVLIEAGVGDKFGAKERDIYTMDQRAVHDALHEIDCDPADIDAVILTHLHFDHAGGLTRLGPGGGPTLTFPNAEYIVQRREWEDAIANKSTMHKTYLRDHLTPEVAERMRLVDGEAEVLPGITVVPMPGHTWGQQAVVFQQPGAAGPHCFVPDVMPTRYHNRPTCNLSYDVEPYTSMLSRIELFERAGKEGWLLTLVHEHGDPHFRITLDGESGSEWQLVEAPQR